MGSHQPRRDDSAASSGKLVVAQQLKEKDDPYTQFASAIAKLQAHVDAERKELQLARQQLEEDQRRFEDETARVQSVLSDSEQVVLSVGGIKFTTTLSTLRNAPESLFNAMFSGRHVLKTDDQGCYFIDRDGRHFHDILNFLRDGHFNYPADGTDYKYLMELRAEADFYGLAGLVQAIDKYPYALTRVQRFSLNTEDSWMYEDGQDEVVFTVDRPCQLLGVGLCGTEGSYTAELEVFEVDTADYSNEVCTLQTAAQSFTKVDGQLVQLFLNAPVVLMPEKVYMVSALIKGTESYCCEECMDMVIAGGVKVTFHDWESPNGTNESRGQFPELYIRALG